MSARDDLIRYLLDATMEVPGNCPEANRVVDAYRDEALREAAAKIRAAADDTAGADDPRWNGMREAADLIDPGQEQS